MIKRLLRSVRQKSKGVRNNIALSLAGSFTAIVFVVWVYHAPIKDIASNKVSTTSDTGFFQLFKDMKDQIASVVVNSEQSEEAELTVGDEVVDYEEVDISELVDSLVLPASTSLEMSTSSDVINVEKTLSRPIRIVSVKSVATTSSTTAIISQ